MTAREIATLGDMFATATHGELLILAHCCDHESQRSRPMNCSSAGFARSAPYEARMERATRKGRRSMGATRRFRDTRSDAERTARNDVLSCRAGRVETARAMRGILHYIADDLPVTILPGALLWLVWDIPEWMEVWT